MKTTVEISDGLAEEVKTYMAQEGVTFRSLVETGPDRGVARRAGAGAVYPARGQRRRPGLTGCVSRGRLGPDPRRRLCRAGKLIAVDTNGV